MHSFWDNLFQRHSATNVGELLKTIPIFSDLSASELATVEKIAHKRSYAAGEVIFHTGDPGVAMYVIKEGSVCIIADEPETVLSELTGGEFFGEIAILNETLRSATARAKSPCTLLAFFKEDLFQVIEDHTRIGVKVLAALARIAGVRLIHANEQIEACRRRIGQLETKTGSAGSSTIGI